VTHYHLLRDDGKIIEHHHANGKRAHTHANTASSPFGFAKSLRSARNKQYYYKHRLQDARNAAVAKDVAAPLPQCFWIKFNRLFHSVHTYNAGSGGRAYGSTQDVLQAMVWPSRGAAFAALQGYAKLSAFKIIGRDQLTKLQQMRLAAHGR